MDALTIIRQKYDHLSSTQKRIADFLLEHPDEACFMSMKELSKKTKVTEVTIVNFTKNLGFTTFIELKKRLQEHIQSWLSPNDKIKNAIINLDNDLGMLNSIIDTDKKSINMTYDRLDGQELGAFVTQLSTAKRIFVVSHGVSLPIGQFFTLRMEQLGVDVTLFDIMDTTKMASKLLHVISDDLFVIISFPNYFNNILNLIEYLWENQIPMVCITDKRTAPVAKYACNVLTCISEDLIFYNSILAPICVVNLIASLCAVETKSKYINMRDKIEQTGAILAGN